MGIICTVVFVFNRNYSFSKDKEVKVYSDYIGKTNECSLEDYEGFAEYRFNKYYKLIVKGRISEINTDEDIIILTDVEDESIEIEAWGDYEAQEYVNGETPSSNGEKFKIGDIVYAQGEILSYVDDEKRFVLRFGGESDGLYKEYEKDEYIYSVAEYVNLCTELYCNTSFILNGVLVENYGIYFFLVDGDTTYKIRLSSTDDSLGEYVDKEVKIKGEYHDYIDDIGLSNVKVIEE